MTNPLRLLATLLLTPTLCAVTPAARADETPAAPEARAKVVFVAGAPSHAPGEHEHRAGSMLLAKELNENMPGVEAVVHYYGWPEDDAIFEGARAIVIYSDGGLGHPAIRHLDKIQALTESGVGLVCIHYAVEVPKGVPGQRFLDWIGGYFEAHWSVNPHWLADYAALPDHPITRGVAPFELQDEWYYHMRFRDGMEGVTPILTALPPDSSLTRPDGPHSGNPHVREAVARGEMQHTAWAATHANGARGFGITGGHFHRSWANDSMRRLVLNAIVWTAGVEVPAGGVSTETPTDEEMQANLDPKGR